MKYDEIRVLVEGALSTPGSHPVGGSVALDRQASSVHLPSAIGTAAKSELAQTYREMYGLFVQVGKHYCQKRDPKCEVLPFDRCRSGEAAQNHRYNVGLTLNVARFPSNTTG